MACSVDLKQAACTMRFEDKLRYKQIMQFLKVAKSTLIRWFSEYKREGQVGRKKRTEFYRKIDDTQLKNLVAQHTDWLLRDFAHYFQCSVQAVSKAFKRLGITRKKNKKGIKKLAPNNKKIS